MAPLVSKKSLAVQQSPAFNIFFCNKIMTTQHTVLSALLRSCTDTFRTSQNKFPTLSKYSGILKESELLKHSTFMNAKGGCRSPVWLLTVCVIIEQCLRVADTLNREKCHYTERLFSDLNVRNKESE